MEIVINCSEKSKKSCFEKQRKFGLDTLQAFIRKSYFMIISIWSK